MQKYNAVLILHMFLDMSNAAYLGYGASGEQ